MIQQDSRKKQFNFSIWLLILAIAAAYRLILLGQPPLVDAEATMALQALRLSLGSSIVVEQNGVYTLATSGLFSLLGDTNSLARLIPALAGLSLIGLAYAWQEKLGKASMALAALVAIDPLLIASSRQVGSPIISMACLLWFLTMLLQKKPLGALISLILGLMSGGDFYFGLLLAFLAYAVVWVFWPQLGQKASHTLQDGIKAIKTQLRWYEAVGLLIVIGAGFFLYPQALSAIASGFISFIKGWLSPYADPWIVYLLAIPVYELLPLAGGVIYGVFRWARGERLCGALLAISLIWFLVAIAYPARNVLYLGLAVLPLLVLLAFAMVELATSVQFEGLPAVGLSLVVAVLITFVSYSLIMIFAQGGAGSNLDLRIFSIVGGVILLLLTVYLISWAWSTRTGLTGFAVGWIAILLIYGLAMGWKATLTQPNAYQELLLVGKPVQQADLLENVAKQVSIYQTGEPYITTITNRVPNDPAMMWALRKFPVTSESTLLEPGFIVDAVDLTPKEKIAYTGEEFVWKLNMHWREMKPQQWIEWFLFRRADSTKDKVVLWVPTHFLTKTDTILEPQP